MLDDFVFVNLDASACSAYWLIHKLKHHTLLQLLRLLLWFIWELSLGFLVFAYLEQSFVDSL